MPDALLVLSWKFSWQEMQPRVENPYIMWTSAEKITASLRIGSLFANPNLKLKIGVLYESI